MKVILLTTPDELLAYEASYTALLNRVGGIKRLYYSIEGIRLALPVFQARGASMFFIAVLEGEELLAVFPFQLVQDGVFKLRRKICFWGGVDIYAVNAYRSILVEGYRPDLVDVAADFLQTELKNRWDVIQFLWIKTTDENVRYFVSRLPSALIQERDERFYFLDTQKDLSELLGAKKLKELRRCRRRLEEDFGPYELCVSEQIDPADLVEIKALHTARQEHKDNDGAFFLKPLENRYVCSLFERWNRLRCVHYYSLRVAGKPIAIWILYQADAVSYGFIMAMDSDFKKYSPSRILTHFAFKNEAEHFGAERIEIGWGTNLLKKDYTSDTTGLYDVSSVNQRLRSRVALALIEGLYTVRQTCGPVDALGRMIKRVLGRGSR